MKHQWLAYVIVGLLSIGAGVAIAGLPNNVPVDATIIPPTTTEAPEITVPETTTPTTTTPPTTVAETTVPDTTEPETTSPETSEPEPAELPDRSEIEVVSANGANVAGAAQAVATQLEGLGYVEVAPRDGTDIVELTTIYYADGFEDAALRLAEDLALLPEFVAPLEDAPIVTALPATVELLAYVGLDRA
jgi:cytoskeletal protein RodZ